MPSMGRKQIQDAFEELSNELRSQRIKEHLYIVGGAAIAMAFRDSRHTFDIDALMLEGHGPVFDASRRIARRNGWPERWLNEAAVAAIPLEPDRRARTVYASSNLVVSAASPQHLLAMNSNSQDGGSGSCGMELAGVCACPREAVAAGLGRLGTRAGVAGLPCTGSGARAGRARRTLAAGFRRSPPLAAGLARCVMLARAQPPGERAVAGAGVAGSRTGRSSCRSRTTP